MDTEEFTFPITTTDPPESPPLWRVSPSASPTLIDHDQGSTSTTSVDANQVQHYKHPRKLERSSSTKDNSSVAVKECNQKRRSFSSVEGMIMKKRSAELSEEDDDDDDDNDQEEEEENKMDMLWENLNEEMWKDREKTVKYNVSKGDIGFGCVSPKLSSKMNGAATAAVISNKKTNVFLIIKVLKKIFLIEDTQQPAVKKRSCSW